MNLIKYLRACIQPYDTWRAFWSTCISAMMISGGLALLISRQWDTMVLAMLFTMTIEYLIFHPRKK